MLRMGLGLLLLAALLGTAITWLISEPMAENWARARAADEPLAQYEARGFAVALLWLCRTAAPVLLVTSFLALRNARRLDRLFKSAAVELVAVTSVHGAEDSRRFRRAATWSFRLAVAACLLMGVSQWAGSVKQRLADWPIYRWNDGATVLPNMSESNRDVIRYLEASTPDGARILVVSDQTLFFVSYYLLPRRVFTKVHPDADRVIPQPNQQRQLAAYRLSDLSEADIERINPDFVLEYFEGPAYVEPSRIFEDSRWIAFVRQLHGDAAYTPSCNVTLRRRDGESSRP